MGTAPALLETQAIRRSISLPAAMAGKIDDIAAARHVSSNRAIERGTRPNGFRQLMPKIKWLNLPPQLRKHLFDRARNATSPWTTSLRSKNGVCTRQTFPRVRGTKTSDRLSFAVKAPIPRLS